ncbi:MAG: CPBP family intramembrane metalloprotease [Chloroflexi bacterium]|nr:CPBP family intramembrane metalloprotease [Chloroflexota bacterium]
MSQLPTATVIVTPEAGGGIPYFLLYAVVMATLFGVGIPLLWMVIIRKRPLSDLGLTFRRWRSSIVLQLVLTGILLLTGPELDWPPLANLVPLVSLVLAIGFFEAVFWRGWVLQRLEEAFGIIPAILLGSALYAAYHIGYGMTMDEMVFLFFIGIMFAVVFRLTGSILILWPLFQPLGQLITLTGEGLTLPLISTLGFIDVLVAMFILIWLVGRYRKRHTRKLAA